MTYKMKSKQEHSNYFVAVEVNTDQWIAPKDPVEHHAFMRGRLDEVAREANRHLDDIVGAAAHWDTETVCIYCEHPIDGACDETTGEPACCRAAITDWEESK